MRKKVLVFAILLSVSIALTGFAIAEVSVDFPRDIRVLAVNGKKAKVKKFLRLPDGVNQLAIRLVKDIGKNFDANMQYSDVIVIKFNAQEAHLNLIVPKITSEYDIKQFNKNLSIQLLDDNGNEVASLKDKLLHEGFQLMRDYPQELTQYNATDAPAAVHAFAENIRVKNVTPLTDRQKTDTALSSSKKVVVSNSGEVSNNEGDGSKNKEKMAEEMLDYWYQQADEKTRAEFLKKLGQ